MSWLIKIEFGHDAWCHQLKTWGPAFLTVSPHTHQTIISNKNSHHFTFVIKLWRTRPSIKNFTDAGLSILNHERSIFIFPNSLKRCGKKKTFLLITLGTPPSSYFEDVRWTNHWERKLVDGDWIWTWSLMPSTQNVCANYLAVSPRTHQTAISNNDMTKNRLVPPERTSLLSGAPSLSNTTSRSGGSCTHNQL